MSGPNLQASYFFEMGRILFALREHPTARAIMALAFIGLDRSEIRGLRREDVDLLAGVVRVRRGVTGTKDVSEGGKTDNRTRDVTIGSVVADILREYLAAIPGNPPDWLLSNGKGNPIDVSLYAARNIRPVLRAADCLWKGYHAGRRGAETEMGRTTNGDTQVTMHHFGHTKEVADRHYMKPIPEKTRTAALALDEAIGNALDEASKWQQVTRIN
jgi:integrase